MNVRRRWEPFTPREVTALLAEAGFRWWVAGGWAIDLFVGRRTRRHHDLDLGVLRRDQPAVQEAFSSWDLWAADPPGKLRRWETGEELPTAVHNIWCRDGTASPWRLQLMLNESTADLWVFRREPSVTRPLDEVVLRSKEGIPYLAPELQLLFKAEHRRPRDDTDFAVALPHLGRLRRTWLADLLGLLYPGHPWLSRLDQPD